MLGVWLDVMDQLWGLMCILLRYVLIRSSFKLVNQICYQIVNEPFQGNFINLVKKVVYSNIKVFLL